MTVGFVLMMSFTTFSKDSTIDDSGIQPTYATTTSDWNGQQSKQSVY